MENTITIEATVDAPVAKVWNLWTNPEHITGWCNASDDWHAPHATNDLKENGKFSTRMEAKDGSFGFDFGGTYTAVKPNEFIAYTLDDDRKVEIRFEDQEGKAKITETFEPENENPREMQQGGWQAILNNFKKYAETH